MKNYYLFLAAIAATMFLPALCHAQAPNLGTAANFALFTTTGAVGNTGSSVITGKVGTNNGAVTGFGNVNGSMHNADGTTAQAASDLLLAYNQLNSAIPTLFPGVLLGNGDTLGAGVYQSPALTTLSGDLYLDALGDTNAVFIFQVQASFNTTVNAKIKLLNGAMACHVFWKVEGVVSLASGNYFVGTIVANNAAINMSTSDTLEGRALSTAGAVNVQEVNIFTPIGCGSPFLTGPAAPNLASAQCYAIFSGNGSVTNAGITFVTGDVGTNVGLTAGYNPLFVNGTVHPIPDVSTAAAAADVVNAYNYLNLVPHEIELLFPAQFGNNLVLTPHTYLLNSSTAFNGTIYLNAQNNPNAVFLIKVNGAFATSTFAKVILLNGANADNVYWVIDGALSVADFSRINGTFVVNNAAIGLTQGDTLTGRVLTTNGALSTADVVVTSPSPCFPLAVQWLYFKGTPAQKNVLLEWGTVNEKNNNFFTLEKSKDAISFSEIARISSNELNAPDNHYSYVDRNAAAVNFYRISQTDIDGQRQYYKTIQVSTSQSLNLHHVVKDHQILIQSSGAQSGMAEVVIYTVDGRKILTQQIDFTNAENSIHIDPSFQNGLYILNIFQDGNKIYTSKFLAN